MAVTGQWALGRSAHPLVPSLPDVPIDTFTDPSALFPNAEDRAATSRA